MVLPCAGEGRAIPRVDTFASNLHDSWGAHALHNSPPANEGGALQDPPRLSTESARSAASQASKASSGEPISCLTLCFRKGACVVTCTQSSKGYAILSTPSHLQGAPSIHIPPPPRPRLSKFTPCSKPPLPFSHHVITSFPQALAPFTLDCLHIMCRSLHSSSHLVLQPQISQSVLLLLSHDASSYNGNKAIFVN